MSEAAELTYPAEPDSNGSAKRYYKRRAYYFGRHNTPESFVLFGEWKRRLIETGEPPEVKTVRLDLMHSRHRNGKVTSRAAAPPSYRWPLAFGFSAAVLALAIVTATLTLSATSTATAKVDGRALSEEEINFVRGLRMIESEQHLVDGALELNAASNFQKLLKEGPKKGRQHVGQEM